MASMPEDTVPDQSIPLGTFLDHARDYHQDQQGLGLLFPNTKLVRTQYGSPRSLIQNIKERLGTVLIAKPVSTEQRAELDAKIDSVVLACSQPDTAPDLIAMEVEHLLRVIRSTVGGAASQTKPTKKRILRGQDRKAQAQLLGRVPSEYADGKNIQFINMDDLRHGDRYLLVDSKGRWFVLQWEDAMEGGDRFVCMDSSVQKAIGCYAPHDDIEAEYGMYFRKNNTLYLKKVEVDISADAFQNGKTLSFWSAFKVFRKLQDHKDLS